MIKKRIKPVIVIAISVLAVACITSVILILTLTLPKNNSTKMDYSALALDEEAELNSHIAKTQDQYLSIIDGLKISETDADQPILDFAKNDYLLDTISLNDCGEAMAGISKLDVTNNTANITYDIESSCGFCAQIGVLVIVPIAKNLVSDLITINPTYKLVDNEKDNCDNGDVRVLKPILYLYPKSTMAISVRISDDSRIITSYPKYNSGWYVTAQPNGDLSDSQGKYYYALYWDEQNTANVDFNTGFYVEKSNTIKFLEEKLSIIGLNDKEKNEFIMYWLPIIEENEKSLVYFELTDERQANSPLLITPKPDSLLRINMHIKKVTEYTKISEQALTKFDRIDFAAIEWGGTIH